MRRFFYFLSVVLLASFMSCNNKTQPVETQSDTVDVSVPDTAVYGICGDGTTMHSLQLTTDDGKTMELLIDSDNDSSVKGGLLCGDRLSVSYSMTEDGAVADKVVNITTLLGHWVSLDRNFTILEDGTVESNGGAESRPYAAWSMVNSNLVLNTDTFSVLSLGADSLELENANGIFVYKRVK